MLECVPQVFAALKTSSHAATKCIQRVFNTALSAPHLDTGGGGGTRGDSGDNDGTDASLDESGKDGVGSTMAKGGTGGQGGKSATSSYGNGQY